ncbi:TIGR03768 family metallophosphoesterase [Thiocystis violacea]|uniref:TIGR03768 family metallophosphoesterase n=1 Tax=Thiocystis violacea TaxID=13725 RepID=UPI001906D824|nr:TIGR03768 family metallophosphoesterase [Thiocystis violacea]MBK1716872.1 TIGR03768 family metallophosphoesterase [Thiocystis violacea]
MKNNDSRKSIGAIHGFEITRRNFLIHSAWTALATVTFPSLVFSAENQPALVPTYPINPVVQTTRQRMLSFSMNIDILTEEDLPKVSEYYNHGYGLWTYGAGLPMQQRLDLMPGYYRKASEHSRQLLRFFAITDIHITDKESPNQLIYFQQENPTYAGNNTSIYSPVMLYTTHVLDAAVQTVNALHNQADQTGQTNPFDFGISLGDACNSTQYNELRWYIDVIEGKEIHPSSSGLGVDSIDYQKPYQAAGLNTNIPLYQTLGNHDHFFIGSFPVNTEINDKGDTIRDAYIQPTVWSVGDVLTPDPIDMSNFPVLINSDNLKPNDNNPSYYTGTIDGTSQYGEIVGAGVGADMNDAPAIIANADRRSLSRVEWMDEFIKSEASPDGYGFKLIDPSYAARDPGFACYSFMPKDDVPLKVIVLDDTQSEEDGSKDIHGHGYLDALRWEWLQAELQAGQDNNQLMIIAAHVPIGVSAIGSETEWWDEKVDGYDAWENAVDIATLIKTLQNTPNLLMWMAGHRHMNTVKAFVSPDPKNAPWKGFWQVETSSLRDWPQQFRTFEIYLNRDYSISIVTTNVDPAVQIGTPAATSREYAIAVQQITKNDITVNNPNYRSMRLAEGAPPISVVSMDPSREQNNKPDPSIKFPDLSSKGVPCNASYNAELVKLLSPRMANELKRLFRHS